MKVLIIYSSQESGNRVEKIRNDISERFGEDTNLRLKPRGSDARKKHYWHHDAKRLIKQADMIVYIGSENSANNRNVKWELKQSVAHKKYIVCLGTNNEKEFEDEVLKSYKKKDIVDSEEAIYSIIDSFNHDTYLELFNNQKFDIGVLMEQYKLFSNSSESLQTRRQNMNSFYYSANTALITIGTTILALGKENNLIYKPIVVIVLSALGILLNLSWQRLLRSYYLNNRGKMKILGIMEKHLAVSLYDAEWRAIKSKFCKEQYVSFSKSEKMFPLTFIAIYALAISISAISFIYLL